ncbi:type II secretion system protein N [Thalassotalea sp. 1_MG-2023]|uniref:type II secretion system protein N n=1 Tax=Thalassotalea sp. 1_MG-2023 TaxID=3062680 RepID=UPI0026E3C662|nr:type II secretion system protein N [Thalassotalea sp. 1_MG-2023]MDO6425712.1 type II secretion system protein N [Thalassotalea sp. 1_MG-2023]
MKKWLTLGAVVIALYLCFLLIKLPAAFVANWVTIPPHISVTDIQGSIWQPKIGSVTVNGTRIEKINLNVRFLSLLSFNPTIDVTFGDPNLSPIDGFASVSHLFSQPIISNVEMNLPAALIAKHIPTPVAVSAHRYINVNIEKFQAAKPVCQQLSGSVTWPNAAVTVLAQKVTLGDLTGELSCQQGEAVLNVNGDNDIGLTFTVNIGANGYAYGNGYIAPTSKTPKAIMQVLPMVSKQDSQGRFPLRF